MTHHQPPADDHGQPCTCAQVDGYLITRITCPRHGQQQPEPGTIQTPGGVVVASGVDRHPEPTTDQLRRHLAGDHGTCHHSQQPPTPKTWPEAQQPTAEQLHRWLAENPDQPAARGVVAHLLATADQGRVCREHDHAGDLHYLGEVLNELAAARRRIARLERTHPADLAERDDDQAAVDECRRADDGIEDPRPRRFYADGGERFAPPPRRLGDPDPTRPRSLPTDPDQA